MYMTRKIARRRASVGFFEAYVSAMIYLKYYVDLVTTIQDDNISYHSENESVLLQALFEYQQCQMECAGDMSDEIDYVQDTVPVADERLSSSAYGARGSEDKSALLQSDAEQMLRVRKSMAHTSLI